MNSVSPSRINTCSIPKHEKPTTVAGDQRARAWHGGRWVGEGNAMDSPQGRTGRGDATPSIASEKVSAGASEAPAIPDQTDNIKRSMP